MLFEFFVQSAQMIALYMMTIFIVAVLKKNNSLVDIGWGIGFVLIAFLTWTFSERLWWQSLTLLLVALWGLRLAWHIGKRNWGKGEDWRYAKWRKEWGKWVIPRSFLQVFFLQGSLMLLISLPIMWIMSQTQLSSLPLFLVGVFFWFIGWVFEVVADAQLSSFVKTKKAGQIMMKGLWKYSRHPNYFGEALLWWGMGLMAFSVEFQYWVFVSPLLISYLLRYVSGVPFLEQKYSKNKDFQEYAKITPIFIPWIPKS